MYAEYEKALSMGQKEFRACNSKGIFPYLPVLDELLTGVETCGEVNVGLVDVPIELIVGTKSSGRKRAFSRSFLPLLEEDSELASKWVALCQAHVSEGIQEPIKVYEFMRCFYVQEGHKRVSVLRYFGAVTIPAAVTRILPTRNDTLENKIYYEFLDFYRCSGLYSLWFGREGSFARFQAAMGKGPEEIWTQEERQEFFSFYLRFSAACEFKDPVQARSAAVGEALLPALTQWGYAQLRDCTEGELKSRLAKIKEALAAQGRTSEEEGGKKNALHLLMQPIKAVAEPIKAVAEPIKAVTQPVKAMLGREEERAGTAQEEAPASPSEAGDQEETETAPAGARPPEEETQDLSPRETTEEREPGSHEDTSHL